MKASTASEIDECVRQGFLERDATGLAELYAPDAVLYDVGPEFEHRGRDAIRQHFEAVFAVLIPYAFDLKTEITQTGDVAWVHGVGVIHARTAQGYESPPMKVRIMDVRRRSADGQWYLAVDHISAQAG
jgi:uncharacterized protein (TIGR02246 family)